MTKFMKKYAQFMTGRYGVDDLFYFLMALVLITGLFPAFILKNGLSLVRWIIFAFGLFRYFSKNIQARQKENMWFMKWFRPIKKELKFRFTRIRYIKTYRYRRCPHCHQQLRLPINKGKHTVICPSCNKEFNVNILF